MNKDIQAILEAYQKPGGDDWEELAVLRARVYLFESTLKACLKHFDSEPNDPGHPELLKAVHHALTQQFTP